jgi:hypothetical protein
LYLMLHALGLHSPMKPDTYMSGLLLVGVSLVVCAVGAYAGALVRRIVWPPSQSVEALPGTGT